MKRGLCLGVVIVSVSGMVWAGRPLAIDDADPAGCGEVEVETGAGYVHEKTCKHWDVPVGVAYGLFQGIEAGIGLGGQFEERRDVIGGGGAEECEREHGVGDLVVGMKWLAVERCPLGARHALAPSVKLPTADEDKELGSGETDGDLTWILSRGIGETAGIHLNAGYSWIGGADKDLLHYGMALDWQMMDSLQWVGEVFAENEVADGAETVAVCNGGIRWSPVDHLTVDMAGGATISGDGPEYMVTAGLTWVFGTGKNDGN